MKTRRKRNHEEKIERQCREDRETKGVIERGRRGERGMQKRIETDEEEECESTK